MLVHKLIAGVLLAVVLQSSAARFPTHIESLEYPDLARRAQIEGEVRVAVQIAANGKVVSAVAKSGHALLGRDAEANARKWVFPTGEAGILEILYDFRLEKPELQLPCTRVIFDLPGKVSVVSNFQVPDH
jgi:TonB family protein